MDELILDETGRIDNVLLESANKRPGCLGQLKGPIADWKSPTRNNHLYSGELWKRVFNLDWVKEAISTKTLYGEADHPGDRLEPSLVKAAVVLTDYNIDEANKTITGTFDILDTPCGRILKTLAEYGSKLGVSSRGRGALKHKGSTNEVDPDAYIFGGFDVVALPAVKAARQDYVNESVDFKSISESLESQIDNCNDLSELRIMKGILDESGLVEVTHKAITKINQLTESTYQSSQKTQDSPKVDNAIVEGLTADLQKAYNKIKVLEENSVSVAIENEEALDTVRLLNDTLKENASYVEVIRNLKDQLSTKEEELSNSNKLIREFKISKIKIRGLNTQNEEMTKQQAKELDDMNKQLDKLNNRVTRLRSTNKSYSEQISDLKSEKSSLEQKVNELEDKLKVLSDEKSNVETSKSESENELMSKLNDAQDSKASVEKELDKTISEYNNLVDNYNLVLDENASLKARYLESQSGKLGMTSESLLRMLPEGYTIRDIDSLVKTQLSERRRMSKLPISAPVLNESTRVVSGNASSLSDDSDELSSTRAILKMMRK